MEELGMLLRAARQEQGISLEQLEQTTKIRRRFLEALETGNFQEIPGDAYLRGFLRSYAKGVGLDPEEVVARYDSRGGVTESQVKPEETSRRDLRARRAKIRRRQRVTALVTFLLIIGVIVYWYWMIR